VSARRTPGEHALRASVASATTKRKSFWQRERERVRERERKRTDASTYARWLLGWLSAVSTVGAVCLFLPRIAVNCSGPAGRDRARSRVSARAIRPVRTRPRGGRPRVVKKFARNPPLATPELSVSRIGSWELAIARGRAPIASPCVFPATTLNLTSDDRFCHSQGCARRLHILGSS